MTKHFYAQTCFKDKKRNKKNMKYTFSLQWYPPISSKTFIKTVNNWISSCLHKKRTSKTHKATSAPHNGARSERRNFSKASFELTQLFQGSLERIPINSQDALRSSDD